MREYRRYSVRTQEPIPAAVCNSAKDSKSAQAPSLAGVKANPSGIRLGLARIAPTWAQSL
jgi:hypothetical protein